MTLLHAWALGLGLAAAVPLLLHFRRRRTDRRVSFPALRYLTRAEDARSRSLAASDLVLLAVRLGVLFALVMAAAGPLVGRGGAADHPPTDLAIVLDNSASTGRLAGDRTLFEVLRERAAASLGAAGPEDRIWVFRTVGGAAATGVGAARALESLRDIVVTAARADADEAIRRAASTLPAAAGRFREIQLFSDLQASGFASEPATMTDAPALVAFVPPPPEETNGAIISATLTGGTTVPSGTGQGLVVRPVRYRADGAGDPPGGGAGPASDPDASVRLVLDDRLAGATRIPWGTAGAMPLPDLSPGFHGGRVEIDPAGARADDLRHFSIRVVPPPAVDLRSEDPSSFLALGIETLRAAGRLDAEGGARVLVIEGVPRDPGATLRDAERVGTVVLAPPLDPVDLPTFHQLLAGLESGWTARPDPGRGSLVLRAPADGIPLGDVVVHRRYLLRPGAGAAGAGDTALLVAADGEPWLVRTGDPERTLLILGSPLVPEATDLPARPAMIPFLEAVLVRWSHLAGWPPSDFDAGEAIMLPPWAATVVAPDGSRHRVEGGGRFVALGAGIYELAGNGPDGSPRRALFAVNMPPAESDPRPLAPGALAERWAPAPVWTAGPGEAEWLAGAYRARRGRDAAPWMIGLALVLVGVELFLATPGRARRAPGGDGTILDPRRGSAEPTGTRAGAA